MSRTTRTWVWTVLVVWAIVLMALAEAKAEDVPPATLTAAQQGKILAASDAAQVAGKEFLKKQGVYDELVKQINKDAHFPEGTRYRIDFDPNKDCAPLPNGDMQCKRKIVPVFPEAKSNSPAPEKK